VRNILDFPDQFSPPANIITLDRNYRSTQTILAAANGVIGLAKERFTNNLWTERTSAAKPQLVTVRDEADQARFIVERILENRESGTLKEQAVLFRTSSHSGPLEIELTRRNIPFVKFGGLKFLDAAHIKDMLALLRIVDNPRDRVAGFRLLHLLPGIGSATAQRVLDRMAEAADRSRRSRASRRHRAPAMTGRASSRPWAISDIRNGLLIWSARTLPDRAQPRSARRDQRPGRRSAARRGLSERSVPSTA
jgi:superfamily I DNA/RNA helicase